MLTASLAMVLIEGPFVEKPNPLIDMDWTVLVQFGIFLVMAAVLNALVFKPYFRVLDERGRRIEGARTDAQHMQEKAAAIITDYEERLLKAKQRGAEERKKLRDEGQAHEREVLGKAREIGQQGLEAARKKSEADRQAAREKLLAESQVIGRRIASRVLGREM